MARSEAEELNTADQHSGDDDDARIGDFAEVESDRHVKMRQIIPDQHMIDHPIRFRFGIRCESCDRDRGSGFAYTVRGRKNLTSQSHSVDDRYGSSDTAGLFNNSFSTVYPNSIQIEMPSSTLHKCASCRSRFKLNLPLPEYCPRCVLNLQLTMTTTPSPSPQPQRAAQRR